MNTVEIYTGQFCGYCSAAKRLLSRKGVAFVEIDIARDMEKRAEMMQRANGRRTIPQIFINGRHVGGYAELSALEREGKLDGELAA